jgi:hypothetical protein
MKKIMNFAVFAALVALQSCEEKGVVIDFGSKEGVTDTTYISAVPVAQSRNVLIEEFTGASCTNCPAGHDAVAAILSSNPNRVVAIAYHTFNPGTIFKPVNKPGEVSRYDFRDTQATLISSTIFGGVSSIPTAGIDRVPVSGGLQVGRNQWASQTNSRLLVAPPANIEMTSAYKGDQNLVVLKVKVTYTQAVTKKNALTLGILESNIVDAQEFADSVDMNYVHNHIFRKCLTPYYGSSVLDSLATKNAGRVYEYNYVFTPSSKWNLDNCTIVAILSNNEATDKEVLQSKEVKLK